MIFEDAHWSDPTSLELFGRAVDRIRTLRVQLIVVPARVRAAMDRAALCDGTDHSGFRKT
jgi:predicted ATPase